MLQAVLLHKFATGWVLHYMHMLDCADRRMSAGSAPDPVNLAQIAKNA